MNQINNYVNIAALTFVAISWWMVIGMLILDRQAPEMWRHRLRIRSSIWVVVIWPLTCRRKPWERRP